jgi:hypothetical protein
MQANRRGVGGMFFVSPQSFLILGC